MTPFVSPANPPAALPVDYMVPAVPVCVSSQAAVTGVGQDRHSHIALRRIKYIARFAYWTARHLSTRHVRWILAFEGYTW